MFTLIYIDFHNVLQISYLISSYVWFIDLNGLFRSLRPYHPTKILFLFFLTQLQVYLFTIFRMVRTTTPPLISSKLLARLINNTQLNWTTVKMPIHFICDYRPKLIGSIFWNLWNWGCRLPRSKPAMMAPVHINTPLHVNTIQHLATWQLLRPLIRLHIN